MKKGNTYTGIVERVDFPNKGIVIVETTQEDGTVKKEQCVVKNTLPGQKVTFVVNKMRKGKAEGRLVSTDEVSALECGSPCPHFGICGGCTYISLPYEEQLKIKEEQIRKLLSNCLDGKQKEYKFEGIKGSPAVYKYRNKMEFSFGDEVKDGPLSLGMHKRGSFYDVVSVENCQIVDEDYRTILKTTLELFKEKNVSFFHRLRHDGYLRHLLVRKAVKTEEILIALVTTTQRETWAEQAGINIEETDINALAKQFMEAEEVILQMWKDRLLAADLKGSIAGILHIQNDSVADVVKSDFTKVLHGQDFFYEELLGLKFKISTFSFFQTNSLGAEVLYQTAREYIGDLGTNNADGTPDKIVYDLYSGTGTIAQLMAPVAKKVIGVEIVEEAVEAAKKNAELNGLENCEFIAGDVLKVLDDIEEKPDFIILDPPRDGIHPKALEKILSYDLGRMIYISCKPTSLVRDLEVFLENGYEVEKVCCVDMFPWTANVETVVLLSKLKSSKKIEVDLDITEMDLTKAEAKATYEEIKQYVMDKFGTKVSTLCIAQVKREFGLIERINYNSGSGKNPVPQVSEKKRDMIVDALKHFQMIE